MRICCTNFASALKPRLDSALLSRSLQRRAKDAAQRCSTAMQQRAKNAASGSVRKRDMETAPIKLTAVRLLFSAVALTTLIVASILTLRPFFEALAWATILAVVLAPMYDRLCRRFPNAPGRNAILIVSAVGLLTCAAFLPVVLALQSDSEQFTAHLTQYAGQQSFHAPAFLAKIPFGQYFSERINRLAGDHDAMLTLARDSRGALLGALATVVNQLFVSVTTAALALFFCFFLLRSGEQIAAECQLALRSIAGARALELLEAVRGTVRGAVYGVVATALAQGSLAGIGYLVAGAPAPFLLGLVTTLFSLIPFGTPLVYTPVAVYLVMSGSTVAGIALLAWGVCVVSFLDNILRPIFISQATQMPMVLSFVGVVGGILEFGLLGIVLGPTILAVILALWREYIRSITHDAEIVVAQ